MTLADILASLFPDGHTVTVDADGTISGDGPFAGGRVTIIGVANGAPPGVEAALTLAGRVLDTMRGAPDQPILVLVDSASQRMRRRDELLGLNEYLAHLAKTLLLATQRGHPTIGLVYGGTAAGAFIATALATQQLVALPGAHPQVMDLPSVARVTKLPLERLQAMARSTAVFAPGLDNMVRTGAVTAVLDPHAPLVPQLLALIAAAPAGDARDVLGAARGGRPAAQAVAARVVRDALHV